MKSLIIVLTALASSTQLAWADQLVNCTTDNVPSSPTYGQTCCLRLPQSISECHGGSIRERGPSNCNGPGCAVR